MTKYPVRIISFHFFGFWHIPEVCGFAPKKLLQGVISSRLITARGYRCYIWCGTVEGSRGSSSVKTFAWVGVGCITSLLILRHFDAQQLTELQRYEKL